MSAWPNPFDDRVTLTWDLPAPTTLKAEVFDLQGRRVALLQDGALPAGRHTLTWVSGSAGAGAYFIRLTTPEGVRTQSVIKGR